MKLIKVEAHGFKSFADKTTLEFDGGIVGIVGPNGSGKSNINDAIKWVLGEQSIKNLRGDSFNDIIFSGSKKVKAMNKAEVILTFDNSENKISIPHKKISISRVVERGISGNKYFINGLPARLKDIKEIAMETGIGKSSLAIISQGTIQNIAQATSEERREFFEEAAGISKYKKRKKTAYSKLEKTSEGLEKISLIVKELLKQKTSLEKQSLKAEKFIKLKKDLKDIELSLISHDLKYYGNKYDSLQTELQDVDKVKNNISEKIQKQETSLQSFYVAKNDIDNKLIFLNKKINDINQELKVVEINALKKKQRRELILSGEINVDNDIKQKTMEEELKILSTNIKHYDDFEKSSKSDIVIKKESIFNIDIESQKIDYQIDYLKEEISRKKAKLEIYKQEVGNQTYLSRGSKVISDNRSLFDGYVGMVMDLIEIKSGFRFAIETILRNTFQHIVVKDTNTAISCVNFLNNNRGGRATFIPLDVIKPKFIRNELLSIIQSQPGFISIAYEVVESKLSNDILRKFLLGNIVVAKDIEAASQISNVINNSLMIVTLNGDVIRTGGVISGGQKFKSKVKDNLKNDINNLKAKIPVLTDELKTNLDNVDTLRKKIDEERSLISELTIETARVIEKKSILVSQFNDLNSKYELLNNKSYNNMKTEKSIQIDLEIQRNSIQTKLDSYSEKANETNNNISLLNNSKIELESSLRNITKQTSAQENEKLESEIILKNWKERLLIEYRLTPDSVIDQFTLNMDKDEAKEKVQNYREEIRNLGSVNLESIDEFKDVNSRYTKIKKTKEEVEEAKNIIISAINSMDEIIISKLSELIDNANIEMNNIFKTMFGGGFAQIKYTNPSDILTTGIDVIAQPPGKTVKNLKLFSGGEKAIIAITLLFSILKSKPIPLCILDEVEAALDEANVVRFANYLQELKKQTQFIVVTHRVGTMSKVDQLFGATMQTRGVTSFFSVKLSETKKLIGK